ncbi:MAG: glycosyltransferase family 39 protein [Chloroflexi bacterium]|uniref:Glycosyltransferase family 39 protein n=1 Tax=Candidatus Chlorohelix allophototropha TaxID=3003348 RepID=A0A8T7M5D8_9CHLR|nr:glycosyltransferase family 39 protein [Chloroflexota bacterium]WJW69211.1 glycosyltransferase family 39 protein [Chloroflexota bacterium L227-S17]
MVETKGQLQVTWLLPAQNFIKQRENTLVWLTLGLLTLVGLGLRLYHIESIPAVWDEVFNYNVARQDLSTIVNTVSNAIEPPLYYFLFRLWAFLCGGANNEFNVRFLSVLIGTATIPVSYWLFRQLVERWWALAGAAMVAVNGYHLYYSQYAKNYVLVTLFAFASLALFLQIISDFKPGKFGLDWRWAVWALLNTLIAYTHYFSVYVVIGEYVTLALLIVIGRLPRLQTLLYTFGSLLASFILYLPWLPVALRSLHERVSDPGWLYYKLDFDFFYRQAAGFPNLFLGLPLKDEWLLRMALALVVGGATAGYAAWRLRRRTTGKNRVLALWILLPAIITPYIGVMIYTNSQLETRNFLGGAGATIYTLLLLMGERLWQWKRLAGAVVLLFFSVISIYSLQYYYRTATHGDDYRVMVAQIRQLESQQPRPVLMIPMKPVEDVLRFYMRDDELTDILRLPQPPESATVPPQGLVIALDQRFADLDWDIKRLIGHLQTYNRKMGQYPFPGAQVFYFLPPE